MLSIEAFSGVIGTALFVAFVLTASLGDLVQKYKQHSKYGIVSVILYILSALSITLIGVVYLIEVNSYLADITNNKDEILASKLNCTVTNVETGFNANDNKFNYIIWFSYANITQFYYKDTCDGIVKCWPAVNDSINCWPLVYESAVIAYTIAPSLPDIYYYEKHRVWAIIQLVLTILTSISLIVILNDVIIAIISRYFSENKLNRNRDDHANIQNEPQLRLEGPSIEVEGMPSVYK
jgi:flagellin-like protein